MKCSSLKSQGTSPSRTLTIPQISKGQELKENTINDERSGNQTAVHGQVEVTSEAQTNDLIEGSDDITDGVIVNFRDERRSAFGTDFTNKPTDGFYF